MKSLLGRAAFKSSGTPRVGSYDEVASEYYDRSLHPTCADFRAASRIALRRHFGATATQGKVADLGCGLSLVSEFVSKDLVLVDGSPGMLAQNLGHAEQRLVNVEEDCFAQSEFDWVFAILADPFNSMLAWKNINAALKAGGRCLFVVPSYLWTSKFRNSASDEQPGLAHFVKADNSSVFLPSLVYEEAEQAALVEAAGLQVIDTGHVFVRELAHVNSPKVSQYLSADDAILDVYVVEKPAVTQA
jgi:SAM-dependent methyltransferase